MQMWMNFFNLNTWVLYILCKPKLHLARHDTHDIVVSWCKGQSGIWAICDEIGVSVDAEFDNTTVDALWPLVLVILCVIRYSIGELAYSNGTGCVWWLFSLVCLLCYAKFCVELTRWVVSRCLHDHFYILYCQHNKSYYYYNRKTW